MKTTFQGLVMKSFLRYNIDLLKHFVAVSRTKQLGPFKFNKTK